MNHELRPPRRGLLPELPDFRSHVARLEYSVFTKADCNLVWKLFSDVSLWPRFLPLYQNVRWQGSAWNPGSRLRMDVAEPINATVDRVVTLCAPPHHLAWINHVRGYTIEQWISIEPYHEGGARIATWLEVTGGDLSRDRAADMHLLETVVRTWFDNFSTACDYGATKSTTRP